MCNTSARDAPHACTPPIRDVYEEGESMSMPAELLNLISIRGHTTDGPRDEFLVTLLKDDKLWRDGEPGGTSKVFKTKHGVLTRVPTGTVLHDANESSVVAELRGLDPNSVSVGDTGRFIGEETAREGQWEVIGA